MFLTPEKKKSRKFDEVIALLDGDGHRTDSGAVVSNYTAVRQSTVWACVRIIAEIIAQLPIEVHVRKNGGYQIVEDHDLLQLIGSPNEWQTQHDLMSFLISWAEMHGNGYLYKIKDGSGAVRRLIPIEGGDCTPELMPDWRISYSIGS